MNPMGYGTRPRNIDPQLRECQILTNYVIWDLALRF